MAMTFPEKYNISPARAKEIATALRQMKDFKGTFDVYEMTESIVKMLGITEENERLAIEECIAEYINLKNN
jgi:hypothetical protein